MRGTQGEVGTTRPGFRSIDRKEPTIPSRGTSNHGVVGSTPALLHRNNVQQHPSTKTNVERCDDVSVCEWMVEARRDASLIQTNGRKRRGRNAEDVVAEARGSSIRTDTACDRVVTTRKGERCGTCHPVDDETSRSNHPRVPRRKNLMRIHGLVGRIDTSHTYSKASVLSPRHTHSWIPSIRVTNTDPSIVHVHAPPRRSAVFVSPLACIRIAVRCHRRPRESINYGFPFFHHDLRRSSRLSLSLPFLSEGTTTAHRRGRSSPHVHEGL